MFSTDDFFEKYAIVFAGGGSKGAWQIGIWKAFQEMGLPPAKIVSGTSAGALNAALYSQGDLVRALDVWQTIDTSVVLTGNPNSTSFAFRLVDSILDGFREARGLVDFTIRKLKQALAFSTLICKLAGNWLRQRDTAIFDSKGLERLVSDSLDWETSTFKIPVFACVHNKDSNSVEYINLHDNSRNAEERRKLLIASASIPYFFPEVIVDKTHYCDGGYGIRFPGVNYDGKLDNVPVTPILNARPDIENYLIIGSSKEKVSRKILLKHPKHFLSLVPEKSVRSRLDFTHEYMDEQIQRGYECARKWLDNLAKYGL